MLPMSSDIVAYFDVADSDLISITLIVAVSHEATPWVRVVDHDERSSIIIFL
jgi:hypothetical protein